MYFKASNEIIVRMERTKMGLCFSKKDKMVIANRAFAVINAPIKNGLSCSNDRELGA